MENVEDSRNGKEKEVEIKRVRGMSLRACVAKAAGWTLEKSQSTTSQEANSNKAKWIDMTWVCWTWEWQFNSLQGYEECVWFANPSLGVGRLRVVGLASHHLNRFTHESNEWSWVTFLLMASGAHLHATWDILAFVPNDPGPKSKHALNMLIILDSTINKRMGPLNEHMNLHFDVE